jgi:hypothetical protein
VRKYKSRRALAAATAGSFLDDVISRAEAGRFGHYDDSMTSRTISSATGVRKLRDARFGTPRGVAISG